MEQHKKGSHFAGGAAVMCGKLVRGAYLPQRQRAVGEEERKVERQAKRRTWGWDYKADMSASGLL